MGTFKSKSKSSASKKRPTSSLGSKIKSVGTSLLGAGRGGGGHHRRSRGPNYWANKVLVAKLKKKYWRIQYGGR